MVVVKLQYINRSKNLNFLFRLSNNESQSSLPIYIRLLTFRHTEILRFHGTYSPKSLVLSFPKYLRYCGLNTPPVTDPGSMGRMSTSSHKLIPLSFIK